MFEIVVTETRDTITTSGLPAEGSRTERYRQVVDSLNLPQLIAAINKVPRVRRDRKPKAA